MFVRENESLGDLGHWPPKECLDAAHLKNGIANASQQEFGSVIQS